MLTEMACPSDRMRLKDKIIANIAKAIKGIQEAVFFKSQAQVDNGPLILRNNDRQCHKLCENLDHVFLHGLRHVTNGYWKVATEFTHKNAVREIERLQNVTTNLGRGRAWIFMSLNECLLESYIRCMSDNVKFLRKHYVKEALLLDQQQMSVLLTLTSGLECVLFKLEYDLPYLDLSAYPPRTRTASDLEEEEADHVSLRSMSSFSSRHDSETAASTPDSTKALTDSDTASVSSMDTHGIRRNSTRVSTVSTDSGCPADLLSLHSNKQRSITPSDTMSVSSHGSAGEPDRLTRLENIVSTADDLEEGDGGGLEVIRIIGSKKSGGKKKKGAKKSGRRQSPLVTQISAPDLSRANEIPDDVFMTRSVSCTGSEGETKDWSLGQSPSQGDSSDGDRLRSGDKFCDSDPGQKSASNFVVDSNSASINQAPQVRPRSSSSKELERLADETRDSLISGIAQLTTTAANIRAKASSPEWPHDAENLGHLSPITVSLSQTQNCLKDETTESQQHAVASEAPATDTQVCDNELFPSPQMYAQALVPEKTMSALQELESKCAQLCKPVNGNFSLAESSVTQKNANPHPENNSDADSNVRRNNAEIVNRSEANAVTSNNGSVAGNTQGNQNHYKNEDEVDFYSAPTQFVAQAFESESHENSYNKLKDYVHCISGSHDDQLSETVSRSVDNVEKGRDEEQNGVSPQTQEYALRLDNNTKLQIMLDIFTEDSEEFVKMFVTHEGHSEGQRKTLFILVTNYVLYFLRQRGADRKFETELKMPLKDLSFITLSLNKQIMNIESSGPNRRKDRIWLTPGDHLLAQEILDCLEEAVKKAVPPTALTSRFNISSDAPFQTIALRKYISRECHCQEEDVEVEDYSLVCWEDAQATKNRQMSTGREGTLLLRVHDPFKGHLWKPVFVVLRDSMLCIFSQKLDSKPQQYVRLDGEQCVGCRLETSLDRPHCIEIILAKGGSWHLSAASFDEISTWRQSLCLAVSEGMQGSLSLSCLPCVSVVTEQKLLLCHEDVQTKFFRTIASAKVEEVTSLTFDAEVKTYCVVEFESPEARVSSECWVLYFNASHEMDRFVSSLSQVWQDIYQVGLVPGTIENLSLQNHCQDQVKLLLRGLAMK